jgi:hypothetical protein
MKKLDACVGDLVEWYDHEKKIVIKNCRGVIIYNNGISYITYGFYGFNTKADFFNIKYQDERVKVLPRKIK